MLLSRYISYVVISDTSFILILLSADQTFYRSFAVSYVIPVGFLCFKLACSNAVYVIF